MKRFTPGFGTNLKSMLLMTVLAFCMLAPSTANAQLTGTKNIPGDYATLADAITDLNTMGVGAGGVILNMTVPETAPAGGYAITATGTAADPIVIQGNANTITASGSHTAGALNDAIFKIIGGDYITISSFVMQENAANTTTAAATNTMTEWGVALLYASATDGAQYNIIQSNTISLNRSYTNSFGIYSNTRHAQATVSTAADITAASGANSFNKVYGNTISNVNLGIAFIGCGATGGTALQDMGNDIGGTSAATGNTITNWGGAAASSTFISNTGTQYGIFMNHQQGSNVSYNTITSASLAASTTLRGILQDFTALSPASGSFTNTISNNTITLTNSTSSTFEGIRHQGMSTALSGVTVSITNNNIINCTFAGSMTGIGNSTSVPGNLQITGNIFRGNTGTGTTSGFTAITNTSGVVNTINISGNQAGNSSGDAVTFSAATSGTVFGINNTGGAATAALTINNNDFRGFVHTVTGSSNHYYIVNSASTLSQTFTGNTYTNLTVNSTGNVRFIANDVSLPSGGFATISNNSIVTAFNKTGAGGIVFLYYTTTTPSSVAGTAKTAQNNNFSNITLTGATTMSGWADLEGASGGGSTKNISNNTFINWICGTSAATVLQTNYGGTNTQIANNTINNITGGGSITGISLGASGTTQTVTSNIIHTLSSTGASAVTGITSACPGGIITRNKIYNLTSNNAGGSVLGITITSNSSTISNNLIGELYAPIASGTDAIRGINITSTSTNSSVNVYYNSIYINASSSGTNFGSSGIYHTASATATTAALDLRNNIIVNTSTANGTGFTVAYRRSGTSLTNFASTSNRNVFYAGTPSAANLIFFDGTNADQTLANYKTRVSPLDANSQTENVNFVSTTGSNANFLNISTSIATVAESGATPVTGITVDYAGNTRSATTPDIGAWEFNGIQAVPTINSVAASPSGTQCVATSRTITANITPVNPLATVTLNYSFNGVAQTPVAMTGGNPNSTSNWTGTIPAATPANATVTWSVTASDGSLSSSAIGTAYQDEPMTGVIAATSVSANPICVGGSTTLSASVVKSGSVTIGAGSSTSSGTTMPFNGSYGGLKGQYLIPASELIAAGLAAGNINSLTLDLTVAGSALNGLSISMGHTSLTGFATPVDIQGGLTQVYSTATYTPVVGLNTFTFSTPFNWDGTSNIIVSTCWSNANTGITSSTFRTDATAYYASQSYREDNQTPSYICSYTGTAGPGLFARTLTRPKMTFSGNLAVPVSSYAWSDGSTTVGTTNPLAVTPGSSTAYTVTATDANGCTVTSTPLPVTVLSIPPAPSATNSSQCGVGVPLASVSGATGSETYNWYAASTGGTPLQAGGSTYTTAINTSTTFYVAISNGTCEGPRTAVIANVVQPDAITASTSAASVCPNGSVTLSVTKAAGPNTYTYTWTASPAAGSGIATSVAGATATVTPTTAGSYYYIVEGVDGSCTALDSIAVTVIAPPVIHTPTAAPSLVCSGTNVSLSATTDMIGAGTASIGTQQSSDYTGGPYREGGCAGNKAQYLFTASELAAANIYAGNITSIAFNVTSLGTGGVMPNYTINIAATSATSLGTTFDSSPGTTVYGPVGYTAVAGINTHTFTTPFNWDGISNIVITICHDYLCTGSSSVALENISGRTIYNNSGNPSNCSVTTGTAGTKRPVITFGAQVSTTGPGSYTWTWNPGNLSGNSVTVTPVNITTSSATETYTVTAVDPVTTCTNTATVSFNVLPIPTAPAVTNSTHCGNLTPTASVASTTGATTPVFAWYTVATGGTAIAGQTGSSLSNYSVSVTDTFYVAESNGTCEGPRAQVIVTVNTPPAITLTPASSTICAGQSASITASSSNQDYTYTWNPGNLTGASQSLSPSATTTYTVTALDNTTGAFAGCYITETTTVTVNPLPSVTAVSASPASVCSGASVTLTGNVAPVPVTIGTANATNSSTSSPYRGGASGGNKTQYLITAAELNAAGIIAGNLNSISFNVTSAGSGSLPNFTIRMEATSLTALTSTFQPAPSTVVYGPQAYTAVAGANTHVFSTPFYWNGTSNILVQVCHDPASPLGTSASVSRYTIAAMSVQSTSTNACSVASGTLAGQRPVMTFNISATGNFNWSWNPGNLSGATATATPVNTTTAPVIETYTLTVTNPVTGCSTTSNVPVTVNPNPVATISASTNVLCNGGNNGAATVTATSGDGTYSYSWNTTPAQTTATASNLAAGTYTVTVTDGLLCSSTASVTITEPAALTSTMMSTNVSCNGGNNGDAMVMPAGGTGTYTYLWSDGQTTQTASNLIAGSYSVTITDQNNCTATASVTITEPAALSATMMSTNVSCNGGSNGDAMVMPAGGTGTYTYLWSDGQTTQTAMNLVAGSYTVTVTDQNNCTTTASVTITEPASPLTATMMSTNVSCNGGTNGDAMVMPMGGTGTYTYLWSDGQTTQTAMNLAAGSYSVTVTDQNNCTTTASVTITEPAALAAIISTTNETCVPGNDGTATATTTGGSGSYTYLWSDASAQTTATATGLAAGIYTVTIDDGICPSITETVTVNGSSASVTASNDTLICTGSTVTLIATGGVSYSWDNNAGTNDTIMVTPATTTTYNVIVTDANGCTATEQVTVTVDAVPVAGFTHTSSGLAYTFTNTSTNAASYAWDFGDGSPVDNTSDPSHTYPFDGTYVVTLVVSNGCSSDTITDTLVIFTTGIENANGIQLNVSPNPSEGIFTLSISNANADALNIEVMDARGRVVYSTVDNNVTPAYQKHIDVTNLAKGVYSLKVRTGSTIVTKRIVIQ